MLTLALNVQEVSHFIIQFVLTVPLSPFKPFQGL